MSNLVRLRELFEATIALPPEQRAGFTAIACGDDLALRDELDALLACDDEASDPLAASVAATAASHFDAATPWLGRRVGNYRIVSEIGHGGMGSVYLAERADREYQSQVAIKLIRGFPSADALERLRRERQVLAGLVHPNIARLLDGGTTAEGQPFLVMEYIEGLPLGVWWAEKMPTLTTRLRLFQQLCRAVHYAHQNLIVHRDLKPANVIVRGDDTPLLLDFGIAKLTATDASGEHATELRAFTVDYASPEQIAGQPVTTASDVFGLGLILYELLCGKPYKSGGKTGSWRESRPARIALQAEAIWIRDDAARIDGDLDHVVHRALAPEPERRYNSAAALAGEIDNYFAGLPLEAGPDRLGYRIRKFVSRHRAAVAAGMLALVGVIGASAWLVVERNRAVFAEQRALTEARSAEQTTEFLLRLFNDADPENTRGRDISARDLLDHGRDLLGTALTDQPLVRARLLSVLGEIYTSIGQPQRSIELLTQSIALQRAPGADPLRLANGLHEVCRAYTDTSQYPQALAACREALTLRQALLPADAIDIGHSYDSIGLVEQGQGEFASADRDYRHALEIFTAAGTAHREDVASTHHNLGQLAAHKGDPATARSEYETALTIKRALFGEAHPRTVNSLNGLAQSEQALGDLVAAKRDFEKVLALRVQVQGDDNMHAGHAHNDLAAVLQDSGDYAAAEIHYRAALALLIKHLPADSMDRAGTTNNLGTLFEDRGDYASALPLFEQSLAIREKKFSAPHPSLARAQHNLARCQFELGYLAAVRPLLDNALTTRRTLPADNAERFDSEVLDAEWQLATGHADIATKNLQALTLPNGRGGYRRRARYAEAIAHIAAAKHDWITARSAEQQALTELQPVVAKDHPLYAQAAARLAYYAHETGDDAAARGLLVGALPVLRVALVAQAKDRVDAERLAIMLAIK